MDPALAAKEIVRKDRERLENLETQIILQPAQFGRRHGSNLRVALIGRPNAGSSTLFNALCGRRTSASPFPCETRRPSRGNAAYATEEFDWLADLYMPSARRPITFALTDSPCHAMADLRCPREEADCEDRGALLSPTPTAESPDDVLDLCPGAGDADVIMVIVRAFEGDIVTHPGATTVDPARDLAFVAAACRLHDLRRLEARIQFLREQKGGNWLQAEKAALLRARDLLSPKKGETKPPCAALRLVTWSYDEVEWLRRLRLLTDKAWVIAINVDLRPYLIGRVPKDLVRPVELTAQQLGVSTRYCVVFSGAFEKRLQTLAEAPTPDPPEPTMARIAPLAAYVAANVSHTSARLKLLQGPLDALQLIKLFTCSADEVRAWVVRDGTTVLQFCGGVHEVVKRNFDVAEICDYADYVLRWSARGNRTNSRYGSTRAFRNESSESFYSRSSGNLRGPFEPAGPERLAESEFDSSEGEESEDISRARPTGVGLSRRCGSEEQVRRKGKVRRLSGEVVLENHQVVFIKFKIPREPAFYSNGGDVAWSSDARMSSGEMDKKAQAEIRIRDEARRELAAEEDHHTRAAIKF